MSLGIFRAFVRPDTRVAFDDLRLWDAFKKSLVGKRVVITIEREADARTRLQERGFHAMIKPWAKECGHQIEALKRDILAEAFGYLEGTSHSGERILRQPSTSKLSKEDYSSLIEWAMQLAAEWDGYICVAPDEFRAAHPERYPVREKTRRVA